MRFCMVTTFYPPFHFGGDATYVRALSRALVEEGHEVEVIHCQDAYEVNGTDVTPTAEAADPGISVHRLKSRAGVLSPLITQQTGQPGLKAGALREILDGSFDVVHFHNISLIGGPGVLAYSRAPVTLYTAHEHWLLCPTHIFWKNRSRPCDHPTCFSCSLISGIPPQLWRYTDLARRMVRGVDALIAPSAYTAKAHRDAGFLPEATVLPLFSTLEPPDPAPFAQRERPLFVCVGRVTKAKGVGPLLKEFETLPDYDIHVIGEGDARPDLQREFAHCPNIRFLGALPQRELISHYSAANALIFPSLAPETFGLAIVEALACGTPAIVRDAGGCREIIDQTEGGIVYQTSDELRDGVQRLAMDQALRHEMGERGRSGVRRLYTKEHHIAGYLDLIRRLSSKAA